jgi:hypothetical protein
MLTVAVAIVVVHRVQKMEMGGELFNSELRKLRSNPLFCILNWFRNNVFHMTSRVTHRGDPKYNPRFPQMQ